MSIAATVTSYDWKQVSAGIVSTLAKPNAMFVLMEEMVEARRWGQTHREWKATQQSRALRKVTDGG